MKLTKTDLFKLAEVAITAAKKAGKLISGYAEKKVEVKNKEAADSLASQVVTEVDVKAQNIILETLDASLSTYNIALLTEESPDDNSRFKKDYFWCIDPMDGTLAFTEQTPGYAVSIALVSKEGDPQIGVVYDPTTLTLYHAINEQGAFKNEKPWHPNLSLHNKSSFTLHIDRTFLKYKNYDRFISSLQTELNNSGIHQLKVQKQAGAVLNAIWTLDQAPGCYFKLPKPTPGGGSLWDFAATACIFNEIGAFAKSFDGTQLDLNRADSTFMNHRGVLFASNKVISNLVHSILK